MADRMRLNGREQEALNRLMVAQSAITESIQCMDKRRYTMIPNLKFKLSGASKHIERGLESILETVPTDQLITIRKNLQHMAYKFGVRQVTKDETFKGVYVEYSLLHPLVEAAAEACTMCCKDDREQKHCKLAAAFDLMVENKGSNAFHQCPYFGIGVGEFVK